MRDRVYRHVRGSAVGYVALFVALGGTGLAATRLPANSVGTRQLRNGAVTGKKVARHALTGANIKLSTLGAVPDAQRLGGRPPGAFQSLITGSCTGNQAISQIATAGTVTCQPTGTGTITGVTAGTGLAGGGSSGPVTMSVANGGIGTPQLGDGSVTTDKLASGALTAGFESHAPNDMAADPDVPGNAALDLSLPAGSYVITAKAVLFNDSSTATLETCSLVDAASFEPTVVFYLTEWDHTLDEVDGMGRATTVLGTQQTFTAASTTVRLTCDNPSGDDALAWIQAVKVAAIH